MALRETLDGAQGGEDIVCEPEDGEDAGGGTQRIHIGMVRVHTADVHEKRYANKVTSSRFDQAEERGAVMRLSEGVLYESREGPAVTCASRSLDNNNIVVPNIGAASGGSICVASGAFVNFPEFHSPDFPCHITIPRRGSF